MLSDYNKLLVYLFSDQTEENVKFVNRCKATEDRIEPPETKLDLIKKVWEKILPHRRLIIRGVAIQTQVADTEDKIYKSPEMSDGERVIFYMIGQCLAAPDNGIIVIDEPKLHLQKSIQVPLWQAIEILRSDCLFVYLTHDVDFAAAQESATKIWIKSFDGHLFWDWEKLLPSEDMPENLLLEILGSRKPAVFVEGDNGSLDVSLYTAILTNFLVIPRGGCSQVIQSVKALKRNTQMHHLEVFGIIDRDRRVPAEIQSLELDSIYVLKVAEVKNLFCTKEVLEIVSERLGNDPTDDFKIVSEVIFQRLQDEHETQVSLRASSEIKHQLTMFNGNQKGAQAINAHYSL